ncbi:MAG: CHC2 zinc finger domain-containing protein, partial [Candidatus Shikimatogenerans sp. JK-2022]|nr:CHC2 zinc finger domain-containing protein [Candidatus Shikimatogenerans bostrichidophilus]
MTNYSNNNILIKKLNIVKIINDYVKLEKCGNNFRGFSPFKQENTPSFMVSPNKNIWKDFSSGKGGNLIKFIIEFFNYNYKEAINFLINKYINKKKSLNSKKQLINKYENNLLTNVNKNLSYINSIYKKKLLENKLVINYLLNRGLNYKTIKKFSIGYSPSNISIIDILNKKNKKINNNLLKNLGLFTIINNNFYYLFKNRIMFPIKDITGNLIGFGGRTFSLLINKNKYINSTNNLIFNKSKIFYG